MKGLIAAIVCVVILLIFVNGQNVRPGNHRRALRRVIRAFNGLCGNTTGLDLNSCIDLLESQDKTNWDGCLDTENFTDNNALLTAICQSRRNFRKMRNCLLAAAIRSWRNEWNEIRTTTRVLRGAQRRILRRQLRNEILSSRVGAANNATACLTTLAG
ncbi:uncharacterized protein LOC106472076 [Limulus polyphemus]|uniref:Uncharacterized protein LOC106472076 n=1 Tax=Limulus polyphemus TaxID=6850 RepID=A0ABM1BT71_LIMPO|nr:uncharacterized protein LOC106472076 [Limulus polyphemus]